MIDDETDPNNADSDGDGLDDAAEGGAAGPDADGDESIDALDPLDEDTDGDGLDDGEEDLNLDGAFDGDQPGLADDETDPKRSLTSTLRPTRSAAI